uniref:Uncharacterized protein n=1 Tax=Rhizophora mucronata TaxID=61149 RepID=A0A2P2NZD6_RHIMU
MHKTFLNLKSSIISNSLFVMHLVILSLCYIVISTSYNLSERLCAQAT